MGRVKNASLYVTLALISFVFPFSVDCGDGGGSVDAPSGWGEAQIKCQGAVQQLEQCCPDFEPGSIACDTPVHSNSGSAGCFDIFGPSESFTATTFPTLTSTETACILAEACEALVRTGVCERARLLAANPAQSVTTGGGSSSAGCGYASGSTPDVVTPLSECGANVQDASDAYVPPHFVDSSSGADTLENDGAADAGGSGEGGADGDGGLVSDVVTTDAPSSDTGNTGTEDFDAQPPGMQEPVDCGEPLDAAPPIFTGQVCP